MFFSEDFWKISIPPFLMSEAQDDVSQVPRLKSHVSSLTSQVNGHRSMNLEMRIPQYLLSSQCDRKISQNA